MNQIKAKQCFFYRQKINIDRVEIKNLAIKGTVYNDCIIYRIFYQGFDSNPEHSLLA
ncbi:hypothetical protein [Mucilaginibacter arboris]|uniref:Uncharacterized protein n=1 Tax=Mucilaginibacter arboris TaxID=2682090 RepID=A0A7K1T1B6_9SPHI|nr:hypothetical protein [Mucilaginibacter arboris]MVN23372.1 hypothetical protein [Mucilaginibacter arboris]